MNETLMENFHHLTRQQYGVSFCMMGHINCKNKFDVIGTLNGQCIRYDPGGIRFPRDSVLRIKLAGNNTGYRYCKLLRLSKN